MYTLKKDKFNEKELIQKQYIYYQNQLCYINKFYEYKNNNYASIISTEDKIIYTEKLTNLKNLIKNNKIKVPQEFSHRNITLRIGDIIKILYHGEAKISHICTPEPVDIKKDTKLTLNNENNQIWLKLINHNSLSAISYPIKELYEKIITIQNDKENNINTIITDNNDYRKKYLPEFRANDGHYVRSQGELLIDNWLYDNNILHEYEKRITINNNEYYADFYIKEKKLYIEYFGLIDDEEYEEKCNNKINLYNKNKIDCIYIYPKDIQHIQDILEDYIINDKIQILDDYDDFF